MAREVIRVGNFKGDHANADDMYEGGLKINRMTADIYARLSHTISAGEERFSSGLTAEARIDLALTQALVELAFYVEIPLFMLPYDISQLNQANLAAFHAFGGRLTREGGNPTVYDLLAYGAAGNATVAGAGTDDTASVRAAVAGAPQGSVIECATKNYKVTGLIQVNVSSLEFRGGGFTQAGILFSGAGACIQLGTDDGQPYDASNYNGTGKGFAFTGMTLACVQGATPLSNGLGNYGAGTYGIRDWRGGSVRLVRSVLSGWDYPFWGIQSDINYFQDVVVQYNHSGIYLGPRSDQARFDHIWSGFNDRVFFFEGSAGHELSHWITDSDGSPTINPCKIKNAVYSGTRSAAGIVFDSPWIERFSGTGDVEAIFDVGSADLVSNGTLTIRNPYIAVNLYSAGGVPHLLYLVRADKLGGLVVDSVSGTPATPWNNLRALIKIINDGASTTVPAIWCSDRDVSTARVVENYSATSVVVRMEIDPNATYTNNVVGGTGGVLMGQLSLQRRLVHNNAAIGATNGDWTINRSYNGTGTPLMWAHSGGSNIPFVLDTMSADRGDTDQTLTVAVDHTHQRWATILTANRTVTLSTTNAKNGNYFRVVRSGVGSFTLDVGGLKTIPSATAAVVYVMYDGSAWRLAGYELL